MAKRLFDLLLAGLGLLATLPLFPAAALGIWLSSPGPIFYRARRVGRGGASFTMYKFRTMRHRPQAAGPAITATRDPRVFAFGSFLRASKLDELPQLFNVLKGDMSIVGPRPEDPEIVARHYGPAERASLSVRPGLTSPGALFAYTHGHLYLDDHAPEASYVQRFLTLKVGLDAVYARHASLGYDLRVIGRTACTILQRLAGRQVFPDPPEARALPRAP
jgi:lipopolysaccharide/colanic/teichoic acid biosynthesis glycosyltransferase